MLRQPRALPSLAAGLLLAAALAPHAAAAQDLRTRIDAAVAQASEQVIKVRQQLHVNPELGNREFETGKLIASHLKGLGLEVRTGVAKTGVIGVLRGGRPGPVVAIRSDMDALPVTEASGYPTPSTKRTTYLGKEVGVAHACGHDIHMAVVLGVASVLAPMKAQLPGTILFVFQPSEEGPPEGEEGGASLMLKEGIFKEFKPTAVFGLHTSPDLPVGQVGYAPGPFFAASDGIAIKVTGKQSHGAAPHDGVDPIVIASQIVMGLQTIRSRNVPPLEASVVTIGIIRGGERYNIIPGAVELVGTVRSYNPEVRALIRRRISEIAENIARAGGGSAEVKYELGSPALLNDSALTRRMAPTLERVVGKANAKVVTPTMGGEDFSLFANEVPGLFVRLGTTRPGGTSGMWHTPDFLGDDQSVPTGMRVMSNLLVDYLSPRGPTP
ncbi:MAG: amidohydrolase [Gemmatimonadetes bacterium]|nr:amidohydrolase [Gemmatimonadota bacterium]